MLSPNKHSHPDKTVIYVATILLRKLKTTRLEKYENLRNLAKKKLGSSGDVLFIPALSFLYILGLILYHPQTDSFEYIGP